MERKRRIIKICSICNKRFNSYLLDFHLKKTHDTQKYQCGLTEMKSIVKFAYENEIKNKYFIIDCLKYELKKDYINFSNNIKKFNFYFQDEILEKYKRRLFTEVKILHSTMQENEIENINLKEYSQSEKELLLNYIHKKREEKIGGEKICPFCNNFYPSIQQHCFLLKKQYSKYSCPKLLNYIIKLKSKKDKIDMLCKAICFASSKFNNSNPNDLIDKILFLEKQGMIKSYSLNNRKEVNDYIIQIRKYFFHNRIGYKLKSRKNDSFLKKKTYRINDGVNFSISFDLIKKINNIFDKYFHLKN